MQHAQSRGMSMEQAPKNDAMRGRERGGCSRRVTIASYLLVAIGLSLLVGCASAGKEKVKPTEPAPAAAVPSPPLPTGPSVVHFTGGREGFLITDPSTMDAQSRADFDQATAMIKEA